MSLRSQTIPAPVDAPASASSEPPAAERVGATNPLMPVSFANWDSAAEWFAPRTVAPAPINRLIVLVPGPYVEETPLARRIWAIASPRSLRVLYLGLGRQGDLEFPLRRALALLAALTRDKNVPTAQHVAVASNWIAAVRGVRRTGDLVVCQAGQTLWARGGRKPLGAALNAALDVPVGVLAGLSLPPSQALNAFAARLARWLLPVAIVFGFTWLQAQLVGPPENSPRTILFSLTVLVEFALIAAWNHLLG